MYSRKFKSLGRMRQALRPEATCILWAIKMGRKQEHRETAPQFKLTTKGPIYGCKFKRVKCGITFVFYLLLIPMPSARGSNSFIPTWVWTSSENRGGGESKAIPCNRPFCIQTNIIIKVEVKQSCRIFN